MKKTKNAATVLQAAYPGGLRNVLGWAHVLIAPSIQKHSERKSGNA
jgi:hypothetical protein